MSVPMNRQYSRTHEWFLVEGDIVTIGITQHAADSLTDITFVELQSVGTQIGFNEPVGEVESVKATSEIFTAIAGEVIEINTELEDHPELINDDAFETGWLVKLKVDSIDPEKCSTCLISAEEYEKLIV